MGAKRVLSKDESEVPELVQGSRKHSSPHLRTSGKFTSPVSLATGTGDAREPCKNTLLKSKEINTWSQCIFIEYRACTLIINPITLKLANMPKYSEQMIEMQKQPYS